MEKFISVFSFYFLFLKVFLKKLTKQFQSLSMHSSSSFGIKQQYWLAKCCLHIHALWSSTSLELISSFLSKHPTISNLMMTRNFKLWPGVRYQTIGYAFIFWCLLECQCNGFGFDDLPKVLLTYLLFFLLSFLLMVPDS